MSELLPNVDPPTAVFSICRTWRYSLRRRWGSGPAVGFVLLNSSTADELKNDPTVVRLIGFAKSWGYGGFVLGNLFAFCTKDPPILKKAADPIGPENDQALRAISEEVAGRIVCGWGNDGAFMGRGAEVMRLLNEWGVVPMALSMTLSGEPGHPLYLRSNLKPFPIGSPP